MIRSRGFLTLAAVASLSLISAAPPHDLSPCLNGRFKDITHTLPDGTIVGEPDLHDWGCVDRGHGAHPGAAGRAAPSRVRVATTEPGIEGVPVPPPTQICMEPAAPNPAEFGTRLQFTVPEAGHVSLIVKHARRLGFEADPGIARTILDGQLASGTFTIYWDLTDDNGARLEPGLYRAVLTVGDEALCGDIEVQ